MHLLRLSLAGLVVLWLVACGSTPDIDPPAELVDFTAGYYVKTLWTQKLRIRDKKTTAMIRPVVEDDMVYMASDRSRVVALSKTKGRERWKLSLKDRITGGLGSAGELLLLGTGKGEVIAVNKRNGRIAWRHQLSSEILASPVEAAGIVVARCVDGRLFGLSTVSGERLWIHEQPVPSLTLRGL